MAAKGSTSFRAGDPEPRLLKKTIAFTGWLLAGAKRIGGT
jgi:hypothetical protein